MPLPWLDRDHVQFPPTSQALDSPQGLLAAGGALSPDWLLAAYQRGIFPWFEQDQPILWWSPDPRLVLFPDRLHISRSLRKVLNKAIYQVEFDQEFDGVVSACAAPRQGHEGTWITNEMRRAYGRLHELGYAHSVETYRGADLVGGLYGVALGKAFFGESMFSRADNASKVALAGLVAELQHRGFELIDCQVTSGHLHSLGAEEISRSRFEQILGRLVPQPVAPGRWRKTFRTWP